MRSFRWQILFLFTALGVGCAAQPPAPPPEADQGWKRYAPLCVGCALTYSIQFFGQTGERTVTTTEQDGSGYFVDDAGGAFLWTASGLRDRKRYLIRAPLEVGRTWKAVLSAGAVEHYRIEEVGRPCACQAGQFDDCLVVQSTLRKDEKLTLLVTFTWAKDVGLVKVSSVARIRGRGDVPQTEQSLLQYRLRPGLPSKGAKKAGPEMEEEGPDTWSR